MPEDARPNRAPEIACSPAAEGRPGAKAVFKIFSDSFEDNALLDQRHAAKGGPRNCDGDNLSPHLGWSGAPAGTRSFAFVIHDATGAFGRGVTHWVGYGVPATTSSFAEGEISIPPVRGNYVPGLNRSGLPIYYGPCPRGGEAPHHYEFQIIATDLDPGALEPGLSLQELHAALDGHYLGSTSIIARYARIAPE